MARQCCFDREEVLERAMGLFWQRGFEATSVANLVEHLGINRFSLYNSFGDKHQLYHLCLEHYQEKYAKPRLQPLLEEHAGLKEIDTLLKQMSEEIQPGFGCFLQSALLERRQLDDRVAALSDQIFANLFAALKHSLDGAKSEGELKAETDTEQLAHWLVLQIQGIRALLRAGQPGRVTPALKQIVSFLRNQ